VALMIEAAGIASGDKVLEVGSGSGYAAAVISRIAGKVIGIERQHDLAELSRERLQRLGYDNVTIVEGDGTRGCADEAPFDAILAAASGSHVPQPLMDQLAPDGRIVMPVGSPGWPQELVKVTKRADGSVERQNLGGVRFVPLIGEEGWKNA
jgi:protein-L-isoaspartate(D-aspartate) O-methyltransferase